MRALFSRLIRTLAAFFRWLFGSKQSSDKPAPEPDSETFPEILQVRVKPVFVDIDVGEFSRSHELEKLGRERGSQNLPPSDASFPDIIEAQIVREVESRMKDACTEYQHAAESYGLAARIAEVEAHSVRVADRTADTIMDMIASWRSSSDRVYTLQENARENKNNLVLFRNDNGLIRPALIPESHVLIHVIFVLLPLLVIETWANGSALAAGLPNGLLEGWSIALILAALNTVVAFLLGQKIGYIGHRRIHLKLIGCGILLLWIAWAGSLNLLIAHYRDALGGADPDNAGRIMLADFRAHPARIADFQSLMLLAVGIIFSIIGFIDGTRIDDMYPGYGRIRREYERSLDSFRTEKESQIEILTRLKDERIKQIRLDTDYASAFRTRIAEDRDRLKALGGQMDKHLQHMSASAQQLIEIYRDANRSARTISPPAYFGTAPLIAKLPWHEFMEFSTNRDLPALNTGGPEQIIQKFKEIIESFPTLDELR